MNADTVEIDSSLKYLWLVCDVHEQELKTVALILMSVRWLSNQLEDKVNILYLLYYI